MDFARSHRHGEWEAEPDDEEYENNEVTDSTTETLTL